MTIWSYAPREPLRPRPSTVEWSVSRSRVRSHRRNLITPVLQELHPRREFLVRLDIVHPARGRRNAESHQRPRFGRRLLGVRRPDVGHVHCQFGGVSDGREDASECEGENILKFCAFIARPSYFCWFRAEFYGVIRVCVCVYVYIYSKCAQAFPFLKNLQVPPEIIFRALFFSLPFIICFDTPPPGVQGLK